VDNEFTPVIVSGARAPKSPLLSVVIPTFNEILNVPVLVARLIKALSAIDWEVIFVDDDSPDGTAEIARQIARDNPSVRCIRRIGRQGLSGAYIEGVLSSSPRAITSSSGSLKVVEVPFVFEARQHSESKLDNMVALEYPGLLLAKPSGDRISLRFVQFALVGPTGLEALALSVHFNWAQTVAAFAAMTWNFFLNNQLSYRDKRLKGSAIVTGLLTFYAVCSVGTIANVAVATRSHCGGSQEWPGPSWPLPSTTRFVRSHLAERLTNSGRGLSGEMPLSV
jgi:hypothetical protein